MRRPPRIHRTGRTMQFNARTTPQTVEALYAIADRQGWLSPSRRLAYRRRRRWFAPISHAMRF
jgi:hypothetical protein